MMSKANNSSKFNSRRKRPLDSVRQQIVELHSQSKQTLSSLDMACDTLRGLEQRLDEFMSDYYAQIGPYMDELVTCEQELSVYRNKKSEKLDYFRQTKAIIRKTEQEIQNLSHNKRIDGEIKQLYRDMVKECHPDTAAGEAAIEAMKQEAMQVINDAYERKSLADMWKHYVQLEIDSKQGLRGKAKLQMLQERMQRMSRALQEVESRHMVLEQSAACALMNRAFEMRLVGKSLHQEIINQTLAQIDSTRQKIAFHQMKERFLKEADGLMAKSS